MTPNDHAAETRPSLILRLRNPDDMAAWQEFVVIYQPLIQSLAVRRGLQNADSDDVSKNASQERRPPAQPEGNTMKLLVILTCIAIFAFTNLACVQERGERARHENREHGEHGERGEHGGREGRGGHGAEGAAGHEEGDDHLATKTWNGYALKLTTQGDMKQLRIARRNSPPVIKALTITGTLRW